MILVDCRICRFETSSESIHHRQDGRVHEITDHCLLSYNNNFGMGYPLVFNHGFLEKTTQVKVILWIVSSLDKMFLGLEQLIVKKSLFSLVFDRLIVSRGHLNHLPAPNQSNVFVFPSFYRLPFGKQTWQWKIYHLYHIYIYICIHYSIYIYT